MKATCDLQEDMAHADHSRFRVSSESLWEMVPPEFKKTLSWKDGRTYLSRSIVTA